MLESPKPVVIYGTGSTGQEIWREFTHGKDGDVVAFSVDRDYMQERKLHGLPVIPFENIATIYPPDEFRLTIGVGYVDRGRLRVNRYQEALDLGYELASCVSRWAITWEDLHLGAGSTLCANASLCPSSCIGNNVFISPSCTIPHDVKIGDHVFMSVGVVLAGGVTVEEGAFLGAGAVVRNGVTIGRDSIVGAGAVILEDTDPEGVYMGTAADKLQLSRKQLNME